MMHSTESRQSGSARARRPQWARAALMHLRTYVWVWALVWSAAIIVVSAVIVIVDSVGTVNVSIAQFVRNGPLVWIVFATAIGAATSITPHVANGMTRRSFIRGALVAAVGNALLHGVTASAVIMIEGSVYERMGWQHDMSPGAEFTAGVWEQGISVLLLDSTLSALGGTVSGLLVAIAYFRLGGWWATLALPLTVLPLLAIEFMTNWSGGWMPWRVGQLDGNLAAVAAVIAGAAAFALLTRAITISSKET